MKIRFKITVLAIIVILVLLSMFFVVLRKDDTNYYIQNNQQELIIKNIQDNVKLINQEENYETKTLDNEEFLGHMTDGGGQLVGYFKDGKIYKIIERLGLSYGVMNYNYYFLNGELIMIHEIEEDFPDFDNTGTLDYTNTELVYEGYYYIDNEKLVYSQVTGKKRFSLNTEDGVILLITAAKQNVELLSQYE